MSAQFMYNFARHLLDVAQAMSDSLRMRPTWLWGYLEYHYLVPNSVILVLGSQDRVSGVYQVLAPALVYGISPVALGQANLEIHQHVRCLA